MKQEEPEDDYEQQGVRPQLVAEYKDTEHLKGKQVWRLSDKAHRYTTEMVSRLIHIEEEGVTFVQMDTVAGELHLQEMFVPHEELKATTDLIRSYFGHRDEVTGQPSLRTLNDNPAILEEETWKPDEELGNHPF